jgi:hypothetical protein
MSDDSYRLPTIPYEPSVGPSLYDLWESDAAPTFGAPLSVRDASYRELVVSIIQSHAGRRRTLLGIGSGNGLVEAELQRQGWDVLATDCLDSALRSCEDKGLKARRFRLTEDEAFRKFDVLYCDGVFGHLWQPSISCVDAWLALAELGCVDTFAIVSNDLADDDTTAIFTVHGSAEARFYRPTAGSVIADAEATGKWEFECSRIYGYVRRGISRRREIVVMKLLVNDGIEAKHLS